MKLKRNQVVRPTLNSERSPSVHYANWKETMLLNKQLSTLHRTERGLLHRITVDQKVIFRHFQVKLQRSKIAHARLSGNKELEKDLRSAGMRRLHSESHLVNAADEEFLSKLERRPYDVDEEDTGASSPQVNRNTSKAPVQARIGSVTEDDLNCLVRSVMNEQPIPSTGHNLRSLSALGHILQASTMSEDGVPDLLAVKGNLSRVKSATDVVDSKVYNLDSPGQHLDTKKSLQNRNSTPGLDLPMIIGDGGNLNHNDVFETRSVGPERERGDCSRGDNRNRSLEPTMRNRPHAPKSQFKGMKDNIVDSNISKNEDATSSLSFTSSTSTAKDNLESLGTVQKDAHPDTFEKLRRERQAKLSVETPSRSPTITPTPRLTNQANNNAEKGVRKKKTSIFEETKKSNFREHRLAQAKAVDHTELVRSFCDGLAALGPGVPDFDYYASKMQEDAMNQVKPALIKTTPGTPEKDYRRYTGDQTIKCITLPRLKLRRSLDDVDDSDNEYYDQQPQQQLSHFDNLVLDVGDAVDTGDTNTGLT